MPNEQLGAARDVHSQRVCALTAGFREALFFQVQAPVRFVQRHWFRFPSAKFAERSNSRSAKTIKVPSLTAEVISMWSPELGAGSLT